MKFIKKKKPVVVEKTHEVYESRLLTANSPFAMVEAYSKARTNIMYMYSEHDCPVYGFTSDSPNEGKSINCSNISISFSQAGKRVLIIDGDMRNASQHSVFNVENKSGLSEYLAGIDKTPNYQDVGYGGLTLLSGGQIPPNPSELISNNRFDDLIESARLLFDYIFIDCPPSLGMLTVKALSVSDGVVIPMQCEFYSLEGMSQLFNTIKKIHQLFNPELRIVGILLTMYNGRLTLTGQVVAELRKYYSDLLFKVPISRTVRLSEAPGYGEPICYHDPYCKGSLEYAAVAKELQLRI